MAKISMTFEEMDAIVTKLENSSNEIEKIWNSIKSTELEQIKESWIGNDCKAYLDKALGVDSDVQKALKAQRLLASTFKKAQQQIIETQERVSSQTASL